MEAVARALDLWASAIVLVTAMYVLLFYSPVLSGAAQSAIGILSVANLMVQVDRNLCLSRPMD
ncbi:MAG: hypothetical protein ACE5FH_03045 [Candidatus Zixiibacteriota bacterium]